MLRDFEENEQKTESTTIGFNRLRWFFVAGLALVFVGILFIIIVSAIGGGSSSTSTGIIIFIGPFPIVIGAGPNAIWLILTGLIITVISVILFVLWKRKAEYRR